jgi:hypothetical protein
MDGPVLLQFLHEAYGKEAVHAILLSDAADFWSAVTAATGQDRDALHAAWRDWVGKL